MPTRHGASCTCAVCEEVRESDRQRGPETAIRIGPGDGDALYNALYRSLHDLETPTDRPDPDEERRRHVIYQARLTPDATLAVEATGNIVLVTPERRITITNVAHWIESLTVARSVAQASTDGGA